MPSRSIETPLGWLAVTEEDGAITALGWRRGGTDDTPLLGDAERQLAAYFDGRLTMFDLPLRPAGDAREVGVVHQDRHEVARQLDVELEESRTEVYRRGERLERVLWQLHRVAAVGDDCRKLWSRWHRLPRTCAPAADIT